jgi:prolipoprotein diacylglyceryl transferase
VTVAFIPSPEHGIVHLGPLPLHAYGLMLAIGVLVAAKIADVRWRRMGNDPKVIAEIAVPVVIAGVIGARIYHLFTGYKWSEGGLVGTVEIWKGGLSIWGAVAGGAIAVIVLSRRRHLDTLLLMDCIAPGLVLAQAIGRWGNYFNQELFGRPTRLPWALEIDVAHRPPGFEHYATFHPTFLYESLWCLLIFGTLIVVEKRFPLRRGQVFALYVAMYTFGRIWFEALRIDDASKIFGIRFNLLLSAVLCVVGVVWFVWLGRRAQPSELHPRPRTVSPVGRPDSEDDDADETAEQAIAQIDDRQA